MSKFTTFDDGGFKGSKSPIDWLLEKLAEPGGVPALLDGLSALLPAYSVPLRAVAALLGGEHVLTSNAEQRQHAAYILSTLREDALKELIGELLKK